MRPRTSYMAGRHRSSDSKDGSRILQASRLRPSIFVGDAGPGLVNLIRPTTVAKMLAAGNIGLYEHANGIASLSANHLATLYAAWGLPTSGQRQSVGEIGLQVPVATGYLAYFGGTYPVEVNANLSSGKTSSYTAAASDAHPGAVYTGWFSPNDLASAQAGISAAFNAGARNVAIFLTPNSAGEDLDDQFAVAPYWNSVRTAALLGGGLALDVPPSYWWARGSAYQAIIVQMVKWATSNGLRMSFVVSPYATVADASGNQGGCGYDPQLMRNTRRLVMRLQAARAMPTQWVVETYCPAGTENNWNSKSMRDVALFLSHIVKNTSPVE